MKSANRRVLSKLSTAELVLRPTGAVSECRFDNAQEPRGGPVPRERLSRISIGAIGQDLQPIPAGVT